VNDEKIELLSKDDLDYMSETDTELQRYFSPEDNTTSAPFGFYKEQLSDIEEDFTEEVDQRQQTTNKNNEKNPLYKLYSNKIKPGNSPNIQNKNEDTHLKRVFAGTEASDKRDNKVMKEINKLQRKGKAIERGRKIRKKLKLHKPKNVCCRTS